MMDEQSSQGPHLKQVAGERNPIVGQEFGSITEAYDFYNQYAREVGFSVRMGSSKKKKGTNEITWKQFVCSKEGEPDETYHKTKKNTSTKEERNVGSTRVGCKAKLSISRDKSKKKWSICNFEECHNHVLSTPTKVHLLPSHRKVSKAKKLYMETLSSANVPTSQQFKIMENEAGGIANVGCIDKDLRNVERDLQKEIKGHDADMLLEYFHSKKEKNPSFYFEVDRDEENRLSRCFWVDSTARKAYFFFGDVVAFDTTYNTNKYSMIFAPFVGVYHHNQTIIFGCGFLSDEKTESFIWLFEQWLKAMPSGPPQLIITDQDQAISKAIAQVFPLAFHRYCIWHIMDKFPQKLGLMLSVYMPQFSASVYGSETIEEYEESWKHALMQHSALENHEWLLQMYKLRKQWVPAFCMHIFSAGMSSSQRVESGHSFFKKYVSKRNSLWDFVTRFERALGHQRHKELVSDHVDVNEVPKLKTLFPIEKQMRGLYTKTIFLKFQDEVIQSTAYLKCDAIREDEKECVYVVIRADAESSTLRHIVHDKVSSFARCSCRKFEFEGIPCRHIVFFLISIHIVDFPSQCIMKRWTKSVKAERVWDGDGLEIKDVQYKSLMMRHIQLSQLSQCLIDESSLMEETTELVRKGIESLRIEVKGLRSSLGVGEVPTKRKLKKHMINEPAQVKAKGSGKRMKSSKEKAMGKAKKYKACGGLGHTIRQCPTSEDGSSIHNVEASHDKTCVPNETPHIVGMHDH